MILHVLAQYSMYYVYALFVLFICFATTEHYWTAREIVRYVCTFVHVHVRM